MSGNRNSPEYLALARKAKNVLPWVCVLCGEPISRNAPPGSPRSCSVEHLTPVALNGGREVVSLEELGLAHLGCNASAGASLGNRMRGRRRRPVAPLAAAGGSRVAPRAPEALKRAPSAATGWLSVPWVAPLVAEMPDTAVWPRLMSAPHPRAVGSYGPEVVARVEARRASDPLVPAHERRLRWFQRLLFARIYEHDSEGVPLFEVACISTSRQVGKSIWLSEGCLDRALRWGELTGEAQLVLHVARDLNIVEEVQRPSRMWADMMREAGNRDYKAYQAAGRYAVHVPGGGRWLARSERGVYGYAASLAAVDECWDIAPSSVDDGISKTMASRRYPQLWLVSTAHRDATATFPRRRDKAISEMDEPNRALIIEWSAPSDADETDEAAWRAASPHYDERRSHIIREDLGTEGFREQWLNIWPADAGVKVDRTRVVVSPERWATLSTEAPVEPEVAAIESWFGHGLSVALAGRDARGRAVLEVVTFDTIGEAAEFAMRRAPRTIIGKDLGRERVFAGCEVRTGRTPESAEVLERLIRDGRLAYRASEALTRQLLGLVLGQMPGGLRVVSDGRFDAVKAAAWAAEEVLAAESAAIY